MSAHVELPIAIGDVISGMRARACVKMPARRAGLCRFQIRCERENDVVGV